MSASLLHGTRPPAKKCSGTRVSVRAAGAGPAGAGDQIDPGSVRRWTNWDHVSGQIRYVTGTELGHSRKRDLRVHDDDPPSACYVLTQSYEMGEEGRRTVIKSTTELTSHRDTFHLKGEMAMSHNGEPVATRSFKQAIARDLR